MHQFTVGARYVLTLQFSIRAGYDDSAHQVICVEAESESAWLFAEAGEVGTYRVFESESGLWLDDMITLPVTVKEAA